MRSLDLQTFELLNLDVVDRFAKECTLSIAISKLFIFIHVLIEFETKAHCIRHNALGRISELKFRVYNFLLLTSHSCLPVAINKRTDAVT